MVPENQNSELTKSVRRREGGLVAVIIGIDGYDGGMHLNCATNDAVSISETLRKVWSGNRLWLETLVWPHFPEGREGDRGGRGELWGIELPSDASGVTRDKIIATIREAAREAGPRDTFLIFFAGHGVLSDGEPCLVAIRDGETARGVEFLRISEIQEAAECESEKRIMILDCCQETEEDATRFIDYLKRLPANWSVLIGSSPGEESFEDYITEDGRGDYLDQGLFTAKLVEGLRGEAKVSELKPLSLMELATYVCNRVQLESEVRITEALARGRAPSRWGGKPPEHQHPILLTKAAALGGPYEIIVAPVAAPMSQKRRRARPSGGFVRLWLKYLTGEWPVPVPLRHMLQEGGACWYGFAMFMIFANVFASQGDATFELPLIMGLISALVWWLMIPFAVAANEDYWHPGGYVTATTFAVWHLAAFLIYLFLTSGAGPYVMMGSASLNVGVQLFFLMVIVIVCGCNAGQAIISLAETVRKDERREIRQAVQVFRQFLRRVWHADFHNYIAMVSARPVVYHIFLGFVLLMALGSSIYIYFNQAGMLNPGITLLRNAVILVFTAWLVFWYEASYRFIQKEVYKL